MCAVQIQKEIDGHKGKGNSRVAKRARAASALIRKSLITPANEIVVREAGPRVRMVLAQELRASAEHAADLNYDDPDNELVGIVAALRSGSGVDARVLCHDTGPMGSAKRIGVPFVVVPDEWLLPPEVAGLERKVQQLESELHRLTADRPDIDIRVLDDTGAEVDVLELSAARTIPLSRQEIGTLLSELKSAFPPMVERAPHPALGRRSIIGTFVPPPEDEILQYETQTYPQWLADCEAVFARLHQNNGGWDSLPRFCIALRNAGSRPAKDALATIGVSGDLRLLAPSRSSKKTKAGTLPDPPPPLRGRWSNPLLDQIASIRFSELLRPASLGPSMFPVFRPFAVKDPNEFSWKPARPKGPVTAFAQECQQWRHGGEPVDIRGRIRPVSSGQSVRGLLTCTVQAENLPTPASKNVVVVVTVSERSVYERALAYIRELARARTRDDEPV